MPISFIKLAEDNFNTPFRLRESSQWMKHLLPFLDSVPQWKLCSYKCTSLSTQFYTEITVNQYFKSVTDISQQYHANDSYEWSYSSSSHSVITPYPSMHPPILPTITY